MFQQDAAKSRIKKLEGDMLGLVSRLKRLSAQASNFSNVSGMFNAKTARAALAGSFHSAGRVQQELQLQISLIRDELSQLQSYTAQTLEFKMAA